jgi:hypothetical protein
MSTATGPYTSEATYRIGPALFRCPVAGCRHTVHEADAVTFYRWRHYRGRDYLQKQTDTDLTCPTHWPQRLKGGPVVALNRPSEPCGEACRWAIGRTCRCSCHGLAHGSGWAR